MAVSVDVSVAINGALFKRNIPAVVRKALIDEALLKVNERLIRKGRFGSGGKGRGVARNYVTDERRFGDAVGDLKVVMHSTLHWPRTSGSAYVKKNIGITKAMAPRVLRKSAERMVTELGG